MLGDFTYAFAIISGLIAGIAIGKITEVYTSGDYGSVKKIGRTVPDRRQRLLSSAVWA